ncbi:MAG: selenide, water dikinase SelD [Myxococcota bacterium]
MKPAIERKTVVLVGGGHAHVQVLRRWAMDPPAGIRPIVVLDRPVAVYSGMVPGLVAGDYRAAELEIDVVPLARRAGAGVVLTPAIDLDPVRHEIELDGRPPLHFDVASLDVGSTVRGLELSGVREHALATRPIGRFVEGVEERIERLGALSRPPRIVLVGGGAAGIELAFTLDARLRAEGLAPDLLLLTSDAEPLRGASSAARAAIAQEAAKRGITLRTGRRVLRVEANAVVSGDPTNPAAEEATHHPADLVVWAAGAAPVAFPAHQGVSRLATDDAGFLRVRDTLQTEGFDDVFAVGDCARLTNHPWVPRAGVYAVRQGPFLEHNLRARAEGRALRAYRPQRDFLSLLNLGGGRALGAKWGRAFRGRSVFRLKDWIDRRFMDRFQMLDEGGGLRASNAKLGAMGGDDEEEMACGGCAAKLGAEPLSAALAALPKPPPDESVVLGLDARDDVAATHAADGTTTLYNVDVIRAFCDDPWLVGRVAAANALSDLHAKGGRPRHAQAIIGLPELPAQASQEELFQTLSGIRSILDPQGVSLLGGHTTLGDALTVGLAVSGEGPDPEALLRQSGARAGDRLLLTQPIGTGVVLAADMQGWASGAQVAAAHAAMQHTNDVAGRLALEAEGAHAATDVTGFGLAGHLLTLLDEAALDAHLERDALPFLPGAQGFWARGLRSTAHPANRDAFLPRIRAASELDHAWLFDPQTAGGLLLAVAPETVETTIEAFRAAGEPPVVAIGTLRPAQGARPAIEIEGTPD